MNFSEAKDKEYKSNTYSRMFALFLNTFLMVDLVRMLLNGDSIIITIVQYGLYGITAVYTYYQVLFRQLGKVKKDTFVLICLIFVVLVASYFVCPSVSQAYSYFIPLLIIRIIPALYYVSHLDMGDLDATFKRLQKYIIFWILYALIGIVYISAHTVSWGQYAANFGFNLLLPASFAFYKFSKVKKPFWLLLTMGFALTITLRGSRTALLCFIIFAGLFYLISYGRQLTTNKIVMFSLLLIAVMFIALNYTTVFTWLSSVFPSSRTLRLLVSGFSFDSGRGVIKDIFLNEINKNIFVFRGIFSDRVFYAAAEGTAFELTGYPHNFFIEVIYQFGIVLGAFILIPLIVCLVRALIVIHGSYNLELKCIMLFLFTTGIVRIFFSGSYLTTVEFYLCLGLIMTNKTIMRCEVDS